MEIEHWQGYLAMPIPEGVVIQSPFGLSQTPVFGSDSDHTTLAIAALEYLLSNNIDVTSCSMPEGVDAMAICAATGISHDDNEPEWNLLVGDDALVVCARKEVKEIPEIDIVVDVDSEFHEAMREAWRMEMEPTNISQGAYVSRAQYEESMKARLGMMGQSSDDGFIWPPRQRDKEGTVVTGSPVEIGTGGTIHSWTTLSAAGAPSEFALRAPLLGGITSALVDLNSGPRGVFLLVDDEDCPLDFGIEVELVVRRIYAQDGFIRYGRKARVVQA
ncbi:MAG: hypothetical protein O3B67_01595 [archaeon]|nr:hypothetical protein [archaeon]